MGISSPSETNHYMLWSLLLMCPQDAVRADATGDPQHVGVGQQNDSKNISYPAHLFGVYGCVRWVFAGVVRVGRVVRAGYAHVRTYAWTVRGVCIPPPNLLSHPDHLSKSVDIDSVR